jgi:hypothetical protein
MKQLAEPLKHLTARDFDSVRGAFHLAAHAKAYAEILQMPHGTINEIEAQNAFLRQLAATPLR